MIVIGIILWYTVICLYRCKVIKNGISVILCSLDTYQRIHVHVHSRQNGNGCIMHEHEIRNNHTLPYIIIHTFNIRIGIGLCLHFHTTYIENIIILFTLLFIFFPLNKDFFFGYARTYGSRS